MGHQTVSCITTSHMTMTGSAKSLEASHNALAQLLERVPRLRTDGPRHLCIIRNDCVSGGGHQRRRYTCSKPDVLGTRTVRRPVASGDDAVHALLGPDLLAKRGDARICHERRVERVDAVPRRISRVRAALRASAGPDKNAE
jgi:hypothetical protein